MCRLATRWTPCPPNPPAPAHQGIALNAVSIHREGIPGLLIEERIEEDRHRVVVLGSVAIDAVGANETRIRVMRVNAEVQPLAVVGNVDLGLFSGGHTVERPGLHELSDARRRAPRGIIQPSVDGWEVLEPNGRDRRTARQHTGGRGPASGRTALAHIQHASGDRRRRVGGNLGGSLGWRGGRPSGCRPILSEHGQREATQRRKERGIQTTLAFSS